MRLPITEFLKEYDADKEIVRLHMPGHKGKFADCCDDITEVQGADSLYEADGIIAESEKLTSELFGTRRTFYSTEGSSQVIKTMCYLAIRYASKNSGDSTRTDYVIAASRNAHKSFINASMLMQFDIAWLPSEDDEYSICKCNVTPEGLRRYLTEYKKNSNKTLAAVFITSPDYLGNMLDIRELSKVAHEFGTLLICDNAHGSYLKFVGGDMHPISIGADMTTDSAHKTLPVLTGGAYLHISKNAPEGLEAQARQGLLLFGSTSPSYKIMRSLDLALERVIPEEYAKCAEHMEELKNELRGMGIEVYGDEPFKLTMDLRHSDIDGNSLKKELHEKKIVCEYGEPDFVVTMWSPFNEYPVEFDRFKQAIKAAIEAAEKEPDEAAIVAKRDSSNIRHKKFVLPEVVYQPYQTLLMNKKIVKVSADLEGEIAADNLTGCPPAITPIIAGERFSRDVIDILEFYGVEEIGIIA